MLNSLNRTYSTLNYLAQLLLILRLSSVNHWLSIDNHMLSSLNRTYIHLALHRNTENKLMITHSLTLTDKHPYSWLISLTLMSYLRRSFFLIVLNVCHTADILGLCLGFAWVTGQCYSCPYRGEKCFVMCSQGCSKAVMIMIISPTPLTTL